MPRGSRSLTTGRLRVALVGCGVMGARHAAVIAADPAAELAVAIDRVPARARAVAQRFGAVALDAVPDWIDAVVIATPTTTHVEVAEPLLERGCWCLVEKPLAEGLVAARRLLGPRCAVGHIERFNPAVRSVGRLAPRVVEARRIAPPSGRNEDIDVVLDLMIHDLDLVLGWCAPDAEVAWVDAAGVSVAGGAIDTASVRFRTTCGLTASLLASRVADDRQRQIRCYEPGRFTVLDLLRGTATRDGAALAQPDSRDALTCQWQAFTAGVRGHAVFGAPAAAGLRAIEVAERVRATIRGLA